MKKSTIPSPVRVWLIVGLLMIFLQIIIGGITRLTGSGLSITKWDIVTGTIPPVSEPEWIEQFDLYKQTPQYQKINQGMSLGKFKWIFFWEYIHRLWARSMGFVFIIPFVVFWFNGFLPKALKTDLGIVVLLAGIVAVFGWIMVASGLVDRPWVNAYKLSLHLGLALVTLCYLWWTYLKTQEVNDSVFDKQSFRLSVVFFCLVCVQILLGGMMSGMKAALMYPSFPMMNQHWIDPIVFDVESWKLAHFVDYDVYPFLPALIQVLHRGLALIILVYFVVVWLRFRASIVGLFGLLGIVLVTQITLGILTLVNSKGSIPVSLGVLHQAIGIVLLMVSLTWVFNNRKLA